MKSGQEATHEQARRKSRDRHRVKQYTPAWHAFIPFGRMPRQRLRDGVLGLTSDFARIKYTTPPTLISKHSAIAVANLSSIVAGQIQRYVPDTRSVDRDRKA